MLEPICDIAEDSGLLVSLDNFYAKVDSALVPVLTPYLEPLSPWVLEAVSITTNAVDALLGYSTMFWLVIEPYVKQLSSVITQYLGPLLEAARPYILLAQDFGIGAWAKLQPQLVQLFATIKPIMIDCFHAVKTGAIAAFDFLWPCVVSVFNRAVVLSGDIAAAVPAEYRTYVFGLWEHALAFFRSLVKN